MSNDTRITAFKGFDSKLVCRGYQYELGKTYEHEGKVVRCASGGFHSCEYPLDVFNYYAPATSRYAVVVAHGAIDKKDGEDSKLASGKITIEAEINVPQLITRAIDWIMARVDKANGATASEERSHASNTGARSAASNTGDYSAASNTGARSAASNTGDYSAASNTGDYSAASNTGDYSAASNTGYGSAASNTGARSAASNTGDYSAASNTGDYSAASNTGARSAASVEGKDSVAMASGYQGKARACAGSAIVLCYRDNNFKLVHIRSAIAGRDGVKPDTWYRLAADGAFVEVPADEE
ncbi:DUF7666 domain-containing protein [Achromobacter pestifer]|uniref:DUF7666 domain-containing protein n=1 Tax=Achromobacter pestifer TaxID=1353889 RepID=A0A6S6YIP7_9BURK|nr:hypothetical protein [Achromobacter pestifer]CAB3624504.1 hypothetical protein LMG3431_00026 [Achromobacter pestifer]